MLNYKEYNKIYKECLELSKQKNQDYGSKSLIKYGNKGILMRVSDKIDRLDNLIFNNKEITVKDEKLEDTVKDIINYCFYIIMQNRNKLEDNNEKM